MYTDKYKAHIKALDKAQTDFDKSPSKKTATLLSNLRAAKYRFTDSEKFTPEHITMRFINSKHDKNRFTSTLSNLLNTIAIEHKFESKQIDEKSYTELHKHNDRVNPLY